MAKLVSCSAGTTCGSECTGRREPRTRAPRSVGPSQELVFEAHHVDEGLHILQISELHPAPADLIDHLAIPHSRLNHLGEAVGEDQLLFLRGGEHEAATHARAHWMQVAQLAAPDL